MENLIAKELLKECPKALETTHNLYGIDFEKPFKIVRIDGAFTINKAITAIGTNDFVVITKLNSFYLNDFYFCTIESGKLNIDYSISRAGNIDNFHKKGQFDERRKIAKVTYLIAQDLCHRTVLNIHFNCNHTPMNNKNVSSIDFNERIKKIDRWYGMQNGYKYFIGNKRCLELDKSGYRIDEKRDELKAKARSLKAEREKAKADNLNIDNDIATIKTEIENLRLTFSGMLSGIALNYGGFESIETLARHFKWIVFDFELLNNRYAKKEFSTPAGLLKSLNALNDKINELKTMLAN